MRIFGVDYAFLSCGSVFTDGLTHAAADIGVEYQHASWDTPDLDSQIAAFAPDLIFVVHGRRFAQRYPNLNGFGAPVAVWLLDEPYEVDETASWSHRFDRVFVNDPATLDRHHRASYLPVCYDPHVHQPSIGPKSYKVGFVGGANGVRERYLTALAAAGCLDYVVGGVWGDAHVQQRCLAANIVPAQTARLYQQTRIILNVFREQHHFNANHVTATSLNPRVYEALACGALVVSEWRPEIGTLVPELPTCRNISDCVELVRWLIEDPAWAEHMRVLCAERMQPHTYAARLRTVLETVGLAVAA